MKSLSGGIVAALPIRLERHGKDGWFFATVDGIKGLVSFGPTEDETLERLVVAARLMARAREGILVTVATDRLIGVARMKALRLREELDDIARDITLLESGYPDKSQREIIYENIRLIFGTIAAMAHDAELKICRLLPPEPE